eukprot:UN08186
MTTVKSDMNSNIKAKWVVDNINIFIITAVLVFLCGCLGAIYKIYAKQKWKANVDTMNITTNRTVVKRVTSTSTTCDNDKKQNEDLDLNIKQNDTDSHNESGGIYEDMYQLDLEDNIMTDGQTKTGGIEYTNDDNVGQYIDTDKRDDTYEQIQNETNQATATTTDGYGDEGCC